MNLFNFLKPKTCELFSGGSGESFETAVVLNTASYKVGLPAQKEFISRRCGEQEKDWKLKSQSLVRHEQKHFDIVVVELLDGTTINFHFDISQFFGKV